MIVFRWIIGIALLLAVAGGVLSVLMFVLRDESEWVDLGRKCRQVAFMIALFWFNVEIWGRVVYTLVTW